MTNSSHQEPSQGKKKSDRDDVSGTSSNQASKSPAPKKRKAAPSSSSKSATSTSRAEKEDPGLMEHKRKISRMSSQRLRQRQKAQFQGLKEEHTRLLLENSQKKAEQAALQVRSLWTIQY